MIGIVGGVNLSLVCVLWCVSGILAAKLHRLGFVELIVSVELWCFDFKLMRLRFCLRRGGGRFIVLLVISCNFVTSARIRLG